MNNKKQRALLSSASLKALFHRPSRHKLRVRTGSVAVAAAVFLLLPSMVPAASAAPEVDRAITFSDVSDGMMYQREMSWLANEGISTGWPDGTYRPLQPIGRDAMAAFLYRAAGSPTYSPPSVSPFADVTPKQQFYKEMAWLEEEGISTGWTESNGKRTYRALQPINRDAMAAFIYRFKDSPAVSLPPASPFKDITASTQFYREIVWLQQSAITTGWDDGTYRPLQPINRDAMAAYLYRLSIPEVVDGVALTPETIVLADATDVLGTDPIASTVTIAPAVGGAPDVDAGNVLVAGFSEATPDGLLVRVDTVITSADGTQVAAVHRAALPDAIYSTDGAVSTTGTVVNQEFVPAEGVGVIDTPTDAANAKTLSAPFDRDGIASNVASGSDAEKDAEGNVGLFDKTFTFAQELTKTTSGKAWKAVDVKGSGTLSLTTEFGVDTDVNAKVDISGSSLKEARFSLDTTLAAESTARATGELTGSATRSLGVVNTWANIQIGVVPVAVQFTSSVDLNVNSQWKADAYVTAEASTTASVGMTWKNGAFSQIADLAGDADATIQGPKVTSVSSLTVGPTLTAKLYGMVGISGGFDAYASYKTASGTCALEAGLRGRIGLVAGIEVFGMKLTDDWKKEFSKDKVLWEGDICDPNEPPVDDVTKDVFGDGIEVVSDGGSGSAVQWGQTPNYGPGGAAWILSTGRMQDSVGDPSNFASSNLGLPGNATLSSFIGGGNTYDAASYWADIVPTGDTLNVRFFFASEEYIDFVGSQYNDVMGVFINGENCALVPETNLPVAVNNVNHMLNTQYYIDNLSGQSEYATAMNGLTVPLTCSVAVKPGTPVEVEIAIADTGDSSYDSAVALLDKGIWSD